jgi:hypothetical protein
MVAAVATAAVAARRWWLNSSGEQPWSEMVKRRGGRGKKDEV